MNPPLRVQIVREPHARDLPLPGYETEHAAGMDLRAAVHDAVTLAPGQRALVPTGVRIALPPGYEAQVRPRSGLAVKYGVGLVNAPGTIDADYRGEICVVLINLGAAPYIVRRGDRIAQLVIAPITRVFWDPADALDETGRGEGGFGHTGITDGGMGNPGPE